MDSPPASPSEPLLLVQGLFLRNSDLIRGFIRALLPDRVRADDVLQETFLTLMRKAAEFEPGTNFVKWACTVARYKVLEERRAMGKASGLLSQEAMEALAVTEEAFSRDPRIDRLSECMESLSDSMRQLVKLRYQEDHTPAEVAERIGWSPNSVYVALSRVRTLLRECLESQPLSRSH